MIKSLKIAAFALAVPAVVLGSTPAFAAAAGQIETGDFYYGKNDTKGTDYSDPVVAEPCDTVTLKMRLHNPGPSVLHDVNVQATVPSGEGASFSSVATVTSPDGDPIVATDSVAINLSKSAKVSYVAGSTQLLDAHSGAIETISDVNGTSALEDGVDIGDIGVSIEQKRFVQYQVKVACPTTPTPETPKTPEAPKSSAPVSKVTPKTLPSTGPEALLGGLTGVSALGYGVSRFVQSRRER